MCGRYNIIDDPMTQLIMEIAGIACQFDTEFNIAPTEQVPVLLKDDQLNWQVQEMRWWLVPHWAKEVSTRYAMFNARSETLSSSPAFRDSFKRKRCIIPASGYYEWRKEAQGKVPFYIKPESEHGFAFAGLWDHWQQGETVIDSCTIITAAAPESMQGIHHRIPVHLAKAEVDQWVNAKADPDQLNQLLRPELRYPLSVTAVSTWVNNARNKDARCIEPMADETIILN